MQEVVIEEGQEDDGSTFIFPRSDGMIDIQHRRYAEYGKSIYPKIREVYSWIGDTDRVGILERRSIDSNPLIRIEGNRIIGLPWPLEIVSHLEHLHSYAVVRTDTGLIDKWISVGLFRARSLATIIDGRLAATCHVWRIGTVNSMTVPCMASVQWRWSLSKSLRRVVKEARDFISVWYKRSTR